MREMHVIDKHAVDHVITNLNDAYSEEIQHIPVLSQSYIHKTIAFDY